MPVMPLRYYKVTSVPPGCTTYALNQVVSFDLPDPAPSTYTLETSGPCEGAVGTLVSGIDDDPLPPVTLPGGPRG